MIRAPVVAIAIAALAPAAHAQRLEFAGLNTAAPPPIEHHGMFQLGDERYVSVSMALRVGADLELDALDVTTGKLVAVRAPAAELARLVKQQILPPDVELVMLGDERAGLHVYDIGLGAESHWYVEIDRKTGAIARTVKLGEFAGDVDMYVIGAELARGELWFYEEHYDHRRGKSFHHVRGPSYISLRRLDLATAAIADVATIELPAREMKSGYEDRLYVHHARDFSRIAFVEYDEDAFKTRPPARVHFVDTLHGTTFSVAAFDTTYGVAFAPDGRYAYIASHSHGTIARVDLAKRRIDKRVDGPTLVQRLIVSPNGRYLYVVKLGRTYSTYELPTLARRTDLEHVPELADAAGQLFSHGQPSLDDRFFVFPDAMHGSDPEQLVIAKVLD
jgi:hypothetical protein